MYDKYSMGAQQAMAAGRHTEAEALFRQALSEAEKENPNDNRVATICNNLANCLRFMGRHPEAEQFYKRALEVRQRALGPLHKEEIVILENYAKLLRLCNREAEAKKMEDRAMGIMKR
jgi:tetratricopeptide (TPR) repeat protein